MPEDDKESPVVEFVDTTKENVIPTDNGIAGNTVNFDTASNELEEAVGAKDLKSFEWMGIKFPPYFKGPHFVDVKGSTVMAIDPAQVTMEMKANWESKYRPELAELGRKVLEKALNIKIEVL